MTTDSPTPQIDERFRPDIGLAHEAVDLLADRQVSDIVLLDLTTLGAFADYFVIGTVDNIRQARAAIDALQGALKARGSRIKPEGNPESGWVLLDTLDGVIVHLFSLEDRARYDLEGLWGRAQEVVRVQ
jgi:ribosome silencing factor RsfS/YbeB/iojap